MTGTLHTTAYRSFARSLAELRRSLGISQQTLADRLGVAQTWVSKCELAERRIDAIELVRIAAALGVTPSRLLDLVETALAENGSATN